MDTQGRSGASGLRSGLLRVRVRLDLATQCLRDRRELVQCGLKVLELWAAWLRSRLMRSKLSRMSGPRTPAPVGAAGALDAQRGTANELRGEHFTKLARLDQGGVGIGEDSGLGLSAVDGEQRLQGEQGTEIR